MAETFRALMIVDQDGKPRAEFKDLTLADLPDHEVLVEISHSTINYKDGMALTGRPIARRLPLVGGIDLAGVVVESRSPEWQPGDKVIVNGWGLSETEWGGYARFQRLKPQWLIRQPEAFSAEQAMAIGTAGYTAALSVLALEDWGMIAPGGAEVLVTGAAGGVGSTAVRLLAKAGYRVTAGTGRAETHDYLEGLGATGFVTREELGTAGAPLQKERWGGAVDSLGSVTLANILAQTLYGGAVTTCGLASGRDLPATVLPHILRGVALLGIDSVMAPKAKRERAWAMLAERLDGADLSKMARVEPLSALPQLAKDIMAGQIQGRVVIDVTA